MRHVHNYNKAFIELHNSYRNCMATHVMYLTSGHPHAMQENESIVNTSDSPGFPINKYHYLIALL